jgi:hypothetical protein
VEVAGALERATLPEVASPAERHPSRPDGHDLGWHAGSKVIGSLDVDLVWREVNRMNVELLEGPIEPASLTCKGA